MGYEAFIFNALTGDVDSFEQCIVLQKGDNVSNIENNIPMPKVKIERTVNAQTFTAQKL